MDNTKNEGAPASIEKAGSPSDLLQRNDSTPSKMNPTSGSPAECARSAALGSHCGTEEQSEHSKSLIPVPPEALRKALEANGDASDQIAVLASQSYSESHPLPPQSPSHKPPTPSPSSTASKKLKKSSKIDTTTKWGTIQTLSSLSLASDLTQLFLDKSQAEKILTGELNLNPAFPAPASANNSSSDGALGNLVHLCLMSKMAQQTSTLTTIRWLFLLLAVGDVATAFFPRVPSLQERIEAYILGESGSAGKGKEIERRREVMEVDLNAEDATRIIEMGLNLVFICDTFGAECVFYLWEHFTANFLRFRVTRRGHHFRSAESNLNRLGLRQKIEADGSDALATSVRNKLRNMYGVNGGMSYVIDTVYKGVTTIKEEGGNNGGRGDLGEDENIDHVINTVDDGVTTIKKGGSDSDGGEDLGENEDMEIEIGKGEGDESDGDGEGTWMQFAIGMGFSIVERMAEMHEVEDIEEEDIEEEDIEEEELEGTTLLHVDQPI